MIPTFDERLAQMEAHVAAALADKTPLRETAWWKRFQANCLSNWYPKIVGLVPTPRTEIVKTECELLRLCDGEEPPRFQAFLGELAAATGRIGYPCFLRTGQTSGKHEWKRTCFVPDVATLPDHVYALVEFSAIVDLPDDVWVVRELLPTERAFTAFEGMPIVRERRYFVENGAVVCAHPYWPPDSIRRPSVPDWGARLAVLNEPTTDELTILPQLSETVGRALGGSWSIDWLHTTQGWFLTDMAIAASSYHWPDCLQGERLRQQR